MTILHAANRFVFQWLGFRVTRGRDIDGGSRSGYGVLLGVLPLTSGRRNYSRRPDRLLDALDGPGVHVRLTGRGP